MKAVAFDLERPATLDDAGKLLGKETVFAKVVAGSQSLGPMLNLRIAQPELLVDITGIPELVEVDEAKDYVELGACVTHADVEDGRVPDPSWGLMPFVASRIAYRAVRNRGTLGGSLAHADPAADWLSALPLLNAELAVWSSRGERTVKAAGLMLSSFTTVLQADELIRAIRIPKLSARARWGFYKFSQKAGEFAHAIGGIAYDPERKWFRAVVGAIESAPIVLDDASLLFGGGFGEDLAERLDEKALYGLLDERGVDDPYHRELVRVCMKRSARRALAS